MTGIGWCLIIGGAILHFTLIDDIVWAVRYSPIGDGVAAGVLGLVVPAIMIIGGYALITRASDSAPQFKKPAGPNVAEITWPEPEKGSEPEEENPKLIPCPDCGRNVSRLAVSCPQCGRPLEPSDDYPTT